MIIPARGRIYRADIGHGLKPFLVVSNNQRNNNLEDCIAVRITTSEKPLIPSIVELTAADHPLVGRVLCDDIVTLFRDELQHDLGAVSLTTMQAVGTGLRAALSLS